MKVLLCKPYCVVEVNIHVAAKMRPRVEKEAELWNISAIKEEPFIEDSEDGLQVIVRFLPKYSSFFFFQ